MGYGWECFVGELTGLLGLDCGADSDEVLEKLAEVLTEKEYLSLRVSELEKKLAKAKADADVWRVECGRLLDIAAGEKK